MNEQEAFNFMVETYQQYKNGDLNEEHLTQMTDALGDGWIQHTEKELIEMGLQFHKIVQEQEQ